MSNKNNKQKTIKTLNPTTEQILSEYNVMNKEQVFGITKKAMMPFRNGARISGIGQTFFMPSLPNCARIRKSLQKIATNEMGKAIRESRSEVEKCAWVMEYFADNGKAFTNDEVVNTDARKSSVTFQPLGVIGSIMPWNFPYWQALRFAAPSLMAGNTVALKPASATMQCGIEIEEAFHRAGLLDGVFNTLVGDSSVAENLIDSNDVSAVTFTGSVPVGAKVAQRATSQVKKCVLELGGSDPFIVCEDADKASSGAVKGRFINCGQSCIASKRFFVAKR